MVDLPDIREYMRLQAERDKQRRSVQVTGPTMEEALNQASIELGLPLSRIEYEVLEKGNKGVFGVGKKDCILIAYEQVKAGGEVVDESLDIDFGNEAFLDEKEQDHDGEAYVKLRPEGVFLKVTAPVGKGKRLSEKEAVAKIKNRGVLEHDKQMVSEITKNADGEYIRIGEYDHNPVNDSVMNVDISDQDMKAFITIIAPGPGGADVSFEAILGFLKNNGIIHGIKEDVLQDLEDHPLYGSPVLVAEGSKPVNGADARIIYNFKSGNETINLKEKNGKVDFKESNTIQNVVEGQALARRVPAEEGKPGRTVTGKLLTAKDGQDIEIGIGKNVRLSEDGNTAIAAINGQVMVLNQKINVEPIYTVNGDVNMKTGGNVLFLGSVIVKGSVADGFKVKAAGNIEVMGNVGKAELDAEGDIIIHQGITGKNEGQVTAGQRVWAKFIENARIDAGDSVIATDGIINSTIDSNKKIICKGKRATIVGGHLRATEEIYAKNLGSESSSETILDVGFDPKSLEEKQQLEGELEEMEKQLEELQRNLITLRNFKKQKKKLPKDKEEYLVQLVEKEQELLGEKAEKTEQLESITDYLKSLQSLGKISASGKVYPGVLMNIKDANLRVRKEFGAITFIRDGADIKAVKFEELEEDISKTQ